MRLFAWGRVAAGGQTTYLISVFICVHLWTVFESTIYLCGLRAFAASALKLIFCKLPTVADFLCTRMTILRLQSFLYRLRYACSSQNYWGYLQFAEKLNNRSYLFIEVIQSRKSISSLSVAYISICLFIRIF